MRAKGERGNGIGVQFGGSYSPSPDRPFKYSHYHFKTEAERDNFKEYFQLANAASRAGFPRTPKGMGEYRELRDEAQDVAVANRAELEAKRKLRAKYNLPTKGRIPARHLKELANMKRRELNKAPG